MGQLESNIVNSFKKVREDMENIQHQISELKENIQDVDWVLFKKEKKNFGKSKKTSNTTKPAKKTFVAAKEGKKFHIKSCPFAKNIQPKSRIIFKTKDSALNKGYKPCKCVQK
ncbi:MAG: hypothetical protein AABW67_02015 [Nanoarchaeota archaeon]